MEPDAILLTVKHQKEGPVVVAVRCSIDLEALTVVGPEFSGRLTLTSIFLSGKVTRILLVRMVGYKLATEAKTFGISHSDRAFTPVEANDGLDSVALLLTGFALSHHVQNGRGEALYVLDDPEKNRVTLRVQRFGGGLSDFRIEVAGGTMP